MTQRNITRYTYETTSFQGWRLSICRKWNQFTKYFSDRQYGSEEAAFQAALDMRDRIFDALRQTPDDPRGVFERFKNGFLPIRRMLPMKQERFWNRFAVWIIVPFRSFS